MPSDGGARWVVAQEERRRYPADKILLDLPLSIASNREPFRHGEWRKQPFIARCAPLPLPLPAIHLCPRWSRRDCCEQQLEQQLHCHSCSCSTADTGTRVDYAVLLDLTTQGAEQQTCIGLPKRRLFQRSCHTHVAATTSFVCYLIPDSSRERGTSTSMR